MGSINHNATISEIRSAKRELEEQIASLLQYYDVRFGISISNIQVQKSESRFPSGLIYSAKVEVEL